MSPLNHVVKGQFYKRNYRKMAISWSFSYNCFVKFYGKILVSHNITMFYQICVITRCIIKGQLYKSSGPKVIKLFSYSTQLSMKFFLLIDVIMLNIYEQDNYNTCEGAQWLNDKVFDLRLKGRGFEPHCLVSLS